MSTDLKIEDILLQVRSKLQQDGAKLWLPPYYEPGIGPVDSDLENLAGDYSQCLGIPRDSCLLALKELQQHALEKLRERNKFKDTGIATLKVRVSSSVTNVKQLNIEIGLDSTGAQLKNAVSGRTDVPAGRLKLIAAGQVLAEDKALHDQRVTNGCQIMAVVLHQDPSQLEETRNQMRELESVKADAKLLASKKDSYMKLEDQFGNAVSLPPKEQKCLLTAMTLHERGKAALKKDDYSLALVMFLDADKEFSQCTSSILESVDNYALLNLDIAWCYLCLRCVSQLPEAEERLNKCQQNFERSYGKNLERLIAVKGTTSNEAVLLMRLHLLQAIVKYHRNERSEALRLLLLAEEELNGLKVDERSVEVLIELGYSATEARVGLRAVQGNVDAAAAHIEATRQKRADSRKRALEQWLMNKERYKLGKCADGKQYVEPKLLRKVQEMGYPKETARRALQQSNNNVSLAVQIIQDDPRLLDAAASGSTESLARRLVADALPHLEAAGFDRAAARRALRRCSGDLLAAIDRMLELGPDGDDDDDDYDDHDDDDDDDDVGDEDGGDDADAKETAPVASSSSSSSSSSASKKNRTRPGTSGKQREMEAYKRLAKDIAPVDDDHLDLPLVQEEAFVRQYRELLISLPSQSPRETHGLP